MDANLAFDNSGTTATDSDINVVQDPNDNPINSLTSENVKPNNHSNEEDSAEIREPNKIRISSKDEASESESIKEASISGDPWSSNESMDQEKAIVETKTKVMLTIDSDLTFGFNVWILKIDF